MKRRNRLLVLCLAFLTLFCTVQVHADSSVQNNDSLWENELSTAYVQDSAPLSDSENYSTSVSFPEILSESERSSSFLSRRSDEEKSLYDLVLENEDHTRTAFFYSSPVKYQADDGSVRDKSTLLYRVDSESSPTPAEQSTSKTVLSAD